MHQHSRVCTVVVGDMADMVCREEEEEKGEGSTMHGSQGVHGGGGGRHG